MEIMEIIGEGVENVYVYTFEKPENHKKELALKVGRANSDVIKRVRQQQASMEKEPVILLVIKTNYSKALESFIHENMINKKLNHFGKEWFFVDLETIKNLYLEFSKNSSKHNICRSNRQIGNSLRFFRILNKLTQKELSDLTNIAQSSISDVEKGKVDVSMETVSRIMAALDVELVMQVRSKS